jgi:hypothetical protein
MLARNGALTAGARRAKLLLDAMYTVTVYVGSSE